MAYDFLFTTVLGFMYRLFMMLSSLPFRPMLSWGSRIEGQWQAISLGDLFVTAVFPLVMQKAYVRQAGKLAVLISQGTLVVVIIFPPTRLFGDVFPVMVILGSLMAVQYFYWHKRGGVERTVG